uniref:Uncharacterized protein n=1 Tax=Acrobeloides nanus TaxID=290746 RepID=A0A914DJP9_9BILA
MLAVMVYNENRMAEVRGDRNISVVYESFSKTKGEKVVKYKKGPPSEGWKKDLVDKSVERKRQQGKGNPIEEDKNEYDENIEIVLDKLETLFNFDSDDEDN